MESTSGYWEHEKLFAAREKGKLVVIEGNRRLAAVKLLLDILIFQFQTGRTAVHHPPVGRAMGLAERGDAVKRAEAIAGHEKSLA